MTRFPQIRRMIAVPLIAVVVGMVSVAAAPTASASVTVGGIGAGAVAHYSCSTGLVEIEPYAMSGDMANPGVWARGSVYDYATGQTSTGNWYVADGITQLTFRVKNPYLVATVDYAVWEGTTWQMTSEAIDITPDLDNGFCSL